MNVKQTHLRVFGASPTATKEKQAYCFIFRAERYVPRQFPGDSAVLLRNCRVFSPAGFGYRQAGVERYQADY